jgi:hypothetical protein
MRLMKNCFLLQVTLLVFRQSNAQLPGNLLHQKATRTRYLMEQIIALQLYLGYVKKGYSIAHDGLTLIGAIKHGELDLHQEYYNSLKTVNPAIKKEAKIAATIATQAAILQEYKRAWKSFKGNGTFSSGELNYLSGVYSYLISETLDNINELLMVTSDGQLQMKDDDRQKNIDRLYKDSRDQYNFLVSFDRNAALLAAGRKVGSDQLNDIRQWYQIP